MTRTRRIRIVSALLAVSMLAQGLPVLAAKIPSTLPDPDGNPGDATKPVKVYILAGQSNMVGFGRLSGARAPYGAIYLTADPAATMGRFSIYRAGTCKIAPLGIYVSADANADTGATLTVHEGDKAVKTVAVSLGISKGVLPVADGQTCVARAFIEVPASGNYEFGPGYGDSTYNVTELDGKEVYRRNVGEAPIRQKVTLEEGKRYPIKITYAKGGSTAFWMRQVDLVGNGDLELVTKRDKKFPWMIDDDGKWTVRNDVTYAEARVAPEGRWCPLSATSNGKFIGPEVPFGYVMGEFHDEQVLLIETSMGNRALSFDFRPPSSGRKDPDSKWESLEYNLMVKGVRTVLDKIDKVVPGYNGQGYEIVGFAWFQGHKDKGVPEEEYAKHLVNLIGDLRKEFKVPKMKAVIASVGFAGYRMGEGDYLPILRAQMAVGDPQKYPDLAGDVASVDTRGFWREGDESPTGTGYHYNHNAETYMLVGDALGRAMVVLMGGEAEPLGWGNRPAPSVSEKASETVELTEEAKAAKAKAAKVAIAPVVVEGMLADYLSNERTMAALVAEATGKKPGRVSQFLRGAMYGLNNYYNAVDVRDYDWHSFGPDLNNVEWDYYSFDPKEERDKSKGARFRKVTFPEGMDAWSSPDFDAKKAGWKRGLPPFGQKDGEQVALGGCGPDSECRCGVPPRVLWEKEVIMIRGKFKVPALKEGHRYRIVVGGSNHVNGGDGYALYVNGKLLAQSNSGVPNRQGGQPRGGHIYSDFRGEFDGGEVTIAAISFLRYNHPRRNPYPPSGHLSVWLQEQKIPQVVLDAASKPE